MFSRTLPTVFDGHLYVSVISHVAWEETDLVLIDWIKSMYNQSQILSVYKCLLTVHKKAKNSF